MQSFVRISAVHLMRLPLSGELEKFHWRTPQIQTWIQVKILEILQRVPDPRESGIEAIESNVLQRNTQVCQDMLP